MDVDTRLPVDFDIRAAALWSTLVKVDILIVMRVNIGNAKANLSALLARAEAGEEVEIARNGVPIVRLTRVERPERPGERFMAGWGALKGQVFLSEDFEFTEEEIDEMLEEDPYKP